MIEFTYTNHRGETRLRKVVPIGIEYLQNPGFDYQPGWFLRAIDPDKGVRSFALVNIVIPSNRSFHLRW